MNRILLWISDLLWPRRCVGCGTTGMALCRTCRDALPNTPRVTSFPSEHVDRLVTGASLRAASLSQAIWHLKYRNVRELASPLADWLAESAGPFVRAASDTLLVPVPLHPGRMRERGFNQAALLASSLARTAALYMDETALTRSRATESQVSTQRREKRFVNMRDAFFASDAVHGRHVVLIDDVCTTGATLEACAAALKAAGARRVTGLVLAHG